jgi:hypothetical protein
MHVRNLTFIAAFPVQPRQSATDNAPKANPMESHPAPSRRSNSDPAVTIVRRRSRRTTCAGRQAHSIREKVLPSGV